MPDTIMNTFTRVALTFIPLIGLIGCTATVPTGPSYKQTIVTPVGHNSRISIYRHTDDKRKSLADTFVEIDGEKAGTLVYGSFINLDIPAGTHRLSVNGFLTPSCSVIFETKEEENVFIEIAPNVDPDPIWVSLGAIGAVIGSNTQSGICKGEYILKQVDHKFAKRRLENLRSEK